VRLFEQRFEDEDAISNGLGRRVHEKNQSRRGGSTSTCSARFCKKARLPAEPAPVHTPPR
jgi:hypothetical protein